MKTAIRNFMIRTHPGFMAVAVLLACALWFICLNYNDPVTYENFTLTLQLRNENVLTENRRLITNRRMLDNITVNVHVTGLKSELDNLVRDVTIAAYVDLHSSEIVNVPVTGMSEPIPVRIGVDFTGAQNSSIQITSIHPPMIELEMDRFDQRLRTVHIRYETEGLPAGYVAMEAEREPRTVQVSGAASVVSRIFEIAVWVDMTDVRTDVEDERPIVAYDIDGEIVTGFNLEIDTVKFKIPVYKIGTAQIQMDEPSYTGTPAPDVIITGVEWEPKAVELMGHVDEVEHVQYIVLSPADISGIVENATFTYDINEYLESINADNEITVMLRNPDENAVSVTYITEPVETREFIIPVDRIALSGEASLGNRRRELLTENITVILSGVASILANTQAEDIVCMVDAVSLIDMEDGEHILEVGITAPPDTVLTGPAPTVRLLLTTPENDNP
ncbi:MAG: CdaR family protein [Defluviitaleaceae bacterium]|nr:CdaR family protein [Defluviitaleaceae bacterium]MCL2835907.1 CdaR family protein [Defluviitaleaceae bacterium]